MGTKLDLSDKLRIRGSMFKNRMLTKVSGSKEEEATEGEKKLNTMTSFIICVIYQLLLG
jgi:hypothetical protein